MFKNQFGQVRSGWLILLAFVIMFVAQILFTIPGTIFLVFSQAVIEDGGMSIEIDGSNEWAFLLTNGFGILGGLIATLLVRSEEHTSELQSRFDLVCRLLLEKKNSAN